MFNWLIQNAIGTVPVWTWSFIAGGGFGVYLIGLFLGRLPEIKPHAALLRFASILAILFGTFMSGSAGVSAVWQAQVQAAEEKVKEAAEESKKVDIKIVTKVVKRTEYIQKRQETAIAEIKQEKEVLDKNCKVPNEFVTIVNKSAEPVK